MKIALDTNILVYASGIDGPLKQAIVHDILSRLPKNDVVLPVQTLGELFYVLIRKARYSAREARKEILYWHETYVSAETSADVIRTATDLAADHRLQIWDAIIVATAASANCRLLLSEDMQEGFIWNGVTIASPFSSTRHSVLRKALNR